MRVQLEYSLFEKKKFIKVLQFLIYFVDTLRANNIVWGVGRGSSVASFCLFLIGVHKINPMIYNLDYKEFLRWHMKIYDCVIYNGEDHLLEIRLNELSAKVDALS